MAGGADLDAIAARIVDAVAGDDELPPEASTCLLRCYVASPRHDLGDALGRALARALEAAGAAADTRARAAWLTLFAETAPIADDERIPEAAGALADRLRATWPGDATTADGFAASAASIDACLRASSAFDRPAIVQPAIDELERIVGASYRPGEGLRLARGADALAAHVACASALLTAFEITARLPYSMLAEELMQPVRRAPSGGANADCAAARVLCRLAALHDAADYRAAAVLAPDADYRADAARMLRAHAALARAGHLTDAARYGIALGELISVRQAHEEP